MNRILPTSLQLTALLALAFAFPARSASIQSASGDANALFQNGEALYHGTNGVQLDLIGAYEAYLKAAELGHTDAQFRLGVRYYFGIGTASDAEESTHWFERAAAGGNRAAIEFASQLQGRLLPVEAANLESIPSEPADAIKEAYWKLILRTDSRTNEYSSTTHPHVLHHRPSASVHTSFVNAEFRALLDRANAGDHQAAVHAGLSLFLMPVGHQPLRVSISKDGRAPEPEPTVPMFDREARMAKVRELPASERSAAMRKFAADYQEWRAQTATFGRIHREWQQANQQLLAFDPPVKLARQHLDRAAAAGDGNALTLLGGWGASAPDVITDRAAPLRYCVEQARKGSREHAFLAGLLCMVAEPATRETGRDARRWLAQAAEAGHAAASARLGRELYSGEKLGRDLPAAARYLSLAAKAGRTAAANLLHHFTTPNLTTTPGPPPAPGTNEIRLAIISEPGVPEQLTDLLQARLSEEPDVVLLERNEIQKVIREQSLNAAAANSTLALGRLLNAQALVFLQKGEDNTLSLRLVTGAQGVVIAATSTKLPVTQVLEWSESAARQIATARPKLALTRDRALPVSIVGISTPIVSSAASELERKLQSLLSDRLYRVPELFVLERYNTGELAREKQLSTDPEPGFWSGAYLIEGGFNRAGGDLAKIDLELRLKPPGGGEPTLLSESGTADDLPALIDRMAGQIAKQLKTSNTGDGWEPALEAARYLQEAQWALRWGSPVAALRASDVATALGNHSVISVVNRVRCHETLLRPQAMRELDALRLAPAATRFLTVQLDRPECAGNRLVLEDGIRLLANVSHLLAVFADHPTVAEQHATELDLLRQDSKAIAAKLAANPVALSMKLHPALKIILPNHGPVTTVTELIQECARDWADKKDAAKALAAQLLAIQPTTFRASYAHLPPARFVLSGQQAIRDLLHQFNRRLDRLQTSPPAVGAESATWKSHAIKAYLDELDRRPAFDAGYFNTLIPESGYTRDEAKDVLERLRGFGGTFATTLDVKVREFQLDRLANPETPPKSWVIVHTNGNHLTVVTMADIAGRIQVRQRQGATFPTGPESASFIATLRQWAPDHVPGEEAKPAAPPSLHLSGHTINASNNVSSPLDRYRARFDHAAAKQPPPPKPQIAQETLPVVPTKPIQADTFWTLPLSKVPSKYGAIRQYQSDGQVFANGSWWFCALLFPQDRSEPVQVLLEVPMESLEPVFHDYPDELVGVLGNHRPFQIAANETNFVMAAMGRLFSKARKGPQGKWNLIADNLPPETRLWSAGGHLFRTDANSIILHQGLGSQLLASTKRQPPENPIDHMPALHIQAVGSDGKGGFLFSGVRVHQLAANFSEWKDIGPRPEYVTTSHEGLVFGFDPARRHLLAWSERTQKFETRFGSSNPHGIGGMPMINSDHPIQPIGDDRAARLETRLNIRVDENGVTVTRDIARRDSHQLVIGDARSPKQTSRPIEFSIPHKAHSVSANVSLGGFVPRMHWTPLGLCISVDRLPGFWLLPPEEFGLPPAKRSSRFAANLAAGQANPPPAPIAASPDTPAPTDPADPLAMFTEAMNGIKAGSKGDWERVKNLLEQAGEKGHAPAWIALVEACQKYPHARDLPRGLKALRRAAKEDAPGTHKFLETLFRFGGWHTPDYAGARPWLEIGAEIGSENCRLQLGTLHHHGLDGPADFDLAMRWYLAAHESKHYRAPRSIGLLYAGIPKIPGREPDYVKAAEWLEQAVEKNDIRAAWHLGQLLRDGHYQNRDKVIPALITGTEIGFVLADRLLAELSPQDAEEARKKHPQPRFDSELLKGTFQGDAGPNGSLTVTLDFTSAGNPTIFYQLTRPDGTLAESIHARTLEAGFNLSYMQIWLTDEGLEAFHTKGRRHAFLKKSTGLDDPTHPPAQRLPGVWKGKWDDTWPLELEFSAPNRSGYHSGFYRHKENVTDPAFHSSRFNSKYEPEHGLSTLATFQCLAFFNVRLDAADPDLLHVSFNGPRQTAFDGANVPAQTLDLRRVK